MGSLFIAMLIIWSYVTIEVCPENPLDPADMCLNLVECGVTDVTPSQLYGDPKYRLLPSTEDSTELFVGALEEFLRIDPTCGSDPWIKSSDRIESCDGDLGGLPCSDLAGPSSDPLLVCANYIRTVEKAPSSKLLVCGTRDAYSRCYTFGDTCALDEDGGPFEGNDCTGEGSYNGYAYAVSANNFNHNTTMAIFDNGGGTTTLFFGSYKQGTSASDVTGAVIGSVPLGTLDKSAPSGNGLVNSIVDNRHVYRANFVGRPYTLSDPTSDYVYFFFREEAREHENQGQIAYARVARVCKNDVGFSDGTWGTHIKARLTCSRPTTPALVSKYYNELEDVFAVRIGGETYFYAAFTTPGLGVHESAVCIYTLTDIDNVFQNSKYLSPDDASSLFTEQNRPTSDPAPGADCSLDSSTFTSMQRTFIENNPLMSEAVSENPIFYSPGVRFSRIVVDNRDSLAENVMFVGTDSGEIWKIYDGGDGYSDSSIKYWRCPDGYPITGLGLIENGGNFYLYATTDKKLVKIDLQHGKAQDDAQAEIIYPPYLASGEFDTPSGVIRSTAVERDICNGNFVVLTCGATLADDTAQADTSWMFTPDGGSEVDVTASGLGHFIVFNKIRSMVYNPLSYLRIETHSKTSGTYRCVISWGANEDSQINTVNVLDCITDTYKTRQDVRKDAVVKEAEYNKQQYNDANSNIKIEYGTCADCPWNTDPGR